MSVDERRPFRKSITLGKFGEYHNNKNDASTKGLLRTIENIH